MNHTPSNWHVWNMYARARANVQRIIVTNAVHSISLSEYVDITPNIKYEYLQWWMSNPNQQKIYSRQMTTVNKCKYAFACLNVWLCNLTNVLCVVQTASEFFANSINFVFAWHQVIDAVKTTKWSRKKNEAFDFLISSC